jgi:N-carbamoyl-L-amino-acid hydrolase
MTISAQDYPSAWVSEARLYERLMTMATFGATEKGGVNRQALSTEDALAQQQLIRWGAALGLKPSLDPAGNCFLRLEGADTALEPVLSGSHLDSQPTGGKFDGVYGVLAALEAVEAIVQSGKQPRRSIEVVAWMNEEGSRFAPGMMGSAAFSGDRRLEDILAAKDADGVPVSEALGEVRQLLNAVPLRALGAPLAAYVEAHIEQGPVLERENTVIGVVSGIQGKCTFRVHVSGEAAHAGTSTRAQRKDALLCAAGMVQALATHLHDTGDVVKFTVGRFTVLPNAPSVVASDVVFSIDLRHPDSTMLRALADAVEPICRAHAGPCSVEVENLSTAMSLEFPLAMRENIARAAARLDISCRDILSTAGHDARYLHGVCPSAMIFVPSHLGLTHCEAESSKAVDLADGARVLADVLAELAG